MCDSRPVARSIAREPNGLIVSRRWNCSASRFPSRVERSQTLAGYASGGLEASQLAETRFTTWAKGGHDNYADNGTVVSFLGFRLALSALTGPFSRNTNKPATAATVQRGGRGIFFEWVINPVSLPRISSACVAVNRRCALRWKSRLAFLSSRECLVWEVLPSVISIKRPPAEGAA